MGRPASYSPQIAAHSQAVRGIELDPYEIDYDSTGGPVHARSDQLDRGRIGNVNRALEPPEKFLARFAADKLRREIS